MDLYTRLFLAPSISYIETIHDRKYSPELKISPTIVNEVRRIDFQVISLFTSSFYMKKGKHTCVFYIKFFFQTQGDSWEAEQSTINLDADDPFEIAIESENLFKATPETNGLRSSDVQLNVNLFSANCGDAIEVNKKEKINRRMK